MNNITKWTIVVLTLGISACSLEEVPNHGVMCPPESASSAPAVSVTKPDICKERETQTCKDGQKDLIDGFCPNGYSKCIEAGDGYECVMPNSSSCCGDDCVDCFANGVVEDAECVNAKCVARKCSEDAKLLAGVCKKKECSKVGDNKCVEGNPKKIHICNEDGFYILGECEDGMSCVDDECKTQ